MASPYTGVPTSTQTPAPAPAPGAIPIVSIPAGTDALSIESITQWAKVSADYFAHIQSAVRLDVPIVAAAGSAFTTVVHTGAGTGTLAPSGSVRISTGTRIVVKIIASGASGAATFATSMDGGNTYGGTQTTAASMTDATSGITFAFTGNFVLSDTYAFRSGYTPQATWGDAAGNPRYIVDHNGFPTSYGLQEFFDQWLWLPGSANSFFATLLGTGSALGLQSPASSYNSRFLQITPSSTAGIANQTQAYTSFLFIPTSSMSLVAEFDVGMNAAAAGATSNTSWFFGFDLANDPLGADTNLVGLVKRYNSTVWGFLSGNGSTTGVTLTGISPTLGSGLPVDRIRIELHGSASAYGAYQAKLFVNSVLAATLTSLLPTGTQRLVFTCANEGGAPVGSPLAVIGPVNMFWNRALAPVAL